MTQHNRASHRCSIRGTCSHTDDIRQGCNLLASKVVHATYNYTMNLLSFFVHNPNQKITKVIKYSLIASVSILLMKCYSMKWLAIILQSHYHTKNHQCMQVKRVQVSWEHVPLFIREWYHKAYFRRIHPRIISH